MLTMGWSDGISFLPVSCALLGSSKERNRLVPLRTDIDRRTNGAKRRREGIRKATGEDLPLAAIYRKIRKRRGRAKILASVMVGIDEDDKSIPIPAKIVFIRDRRIKKWLALAKRTKQDPRTLGTLFHACCDELKQTGFTEALLLLLSLLEQALSNIVGISKELIRSLVERFLNELQPFYKKRLLLSGIIQHVSC